MRIDPQGAKNGIEPTLIGWNRNALQLGVFAADDRDVTFRDAKRLRHDRYQFAVRRAFDGRGLQAHEDGAVADAVDAGFTGARNDANDELNHAADAVTRGDCTVRE